VRAHELNVAEHVSIPYLLGGAPAIAKKTEFGRTVVHVQEVQALCHLWRHSEDGPLGQRPALSHLGDAADTITDTSKAVGSPLRGDITATCKDTTASQAAAPLAASRLQACESVYIYVHVSTHTIDSAYLGAT
jgi:hypothetical protein